MTLCFTLFDTLFENTCTQIKIYKSPTKMYYFDLRRRLVFQGLMFRLYNTRTKKKPYLYLYIICNEIADIHNKFSHIFNIIAGMHIWYNNVQ